MTNLIILILCSIGMTLIMLYGKIFSNLRARLFNLNISWLTTLLTCSMCMGFHSGMIINLLMTVMGMSLFPNLLIGCFLSGCLSSVCSWAADKLIDDDGLQIKMK